MLQKTPERRRNNNKELCVDGAIHQNNNGLRNPSVKKGIQNNNMSFPVPCKNKPKVYGYSRVFCPGNVSVVLERLNATRNKISRHSGKNKSQQGGAVSTPYVRTSNRGLGLPEKGHIQSAWMFFKTNNKPKSCTVHTYSKKSLKIILLEKTPIIIIYSYEYRLYVHLGIPPRKKRGDPTWGCRSQLKRQQKRAAKGGKTPNDAKRRHTHTHTMDKNLDRHETPTYTEYQLMMRIANRRE